MKRRAGRLLERRSFRHIDHDLNLAFVVKGEHFDCDDFECDQADGSQQKQHDYDNEPFAFAVYFNDCMHGFAIESGDPALFWLVMAGGVCLF